MTDSKVCMSYRDQRRQQFRDATDFRQLCRQILRPLVSADGSEREGWRLASMDLWYVALELHAEDVYCTVLAEAQAELRRLRNGTKE